MFRIRPSDRWLNRSAALVAAALGATLLATPQASARPPFPPFPVKLVNVVYGTCLIDDPRESRPLLGDCGGPTASWLHDGDRVEELRNLQTGRCLTRAGRLQRCETVSDPQRLVVRAAQVSEDAYEVYLPYSNDTSYFLQARPDSPEVTTSTQRPGPPALGFWRFV